jgi:hypothetical protein
LSTFILHVDAEMDALEVADLLDRMGVAEHDCVALRMHRADKTFWDWCVSGTSEEMEAALAVLEAGGRNVH